MSESENPWDDLISAAQAAVGKAESGDASAARKVLSQCAVALGDVLQHRQLPDPERLIYLSFLLRGLRQVLNNGVRVDKALGLYAGNRPPLANPDERDFVMFCKVGKELDRLKAMHAELQTVAVARANVARQMRRPSEFSETLRKAWERCGGIKNWQRIRREWEES